MFVHPWALIAIATVGLPLAIHWLTRPRPTPVPLSTLRFVREAVQQRRARHRMRDALILALRMIAIALIAVTVARPHWGDKPLIDPDDASSAVRVVVLDVSQSMAALANGTTNFERARAIAAGHLKYRPGLRCNLIIAGARSKGIFAAASQNFESLRQSLDRSTVTAEELDVSRALELAAEMLAVGTSEGSDAIDSPRRELVIVSDFQRSNWAKADFAVLPQETKIQLESVAEATAPNVAIHGARIRGRATPGVPVQMELEIGNYTPAAQRIATEVSLGDAVFRIEGVCPAGRTTLLAQDIRLPNAGWHLGRARVTGFNDVLVADDERPLALEAGSLPKYALVTRQPARERPSSSHYLECALVPESVALPTASKSAQCVRVDPAALDRQQLVESDLIVLDHPGTLSAESLALISDLLRRGWPILYVAAEAADAKNIGLLTEDAGGVNLPVQFAPLGTRQARSSAVLSSIRGEAPPFRVLGESALSLAKQLRFGGGLATRRTPESLDDDVLATYSDGSAFLVINSAGAKSLGGSLAVLNADLAESTLPRSEAFVPLLDDLVSDMLDRRRTYIEAVAGEPLLARLPLAGGESAGAQSPLKLRGPLVDQSDLGALEQEAGGVTWRWQTPSPPGVYRVEQDGQVRYALAVGISANESQLESLPAEVLTDRLAGGRSVYFRTAGGNDNTQDTLWVWMLAGCVLCLLGELGATLAFRS